MKVIDQKTEERQEFLTLEFEPAEVEEAMQKSYLEMVKSTEVPGFRKGKAPRSVLEQYIGKDKLFDKALKSMLPQACANAISEKEIKPIANPGVRFIKKEPVTVEIVVPLEPVVKLGDYQKIRIKPEPVKIKKAEVSDALENLRRDRITYEPVEREVKVNDLAVIDIEASVAGETLLSEKGSNYKVLSDLAFPAPGFPEQLIGMKRGEEKEFVLKLPKNYRQKDMAEKEAQFKVKISEIKEEKTPELNDDFAKSLAADIETVDALKERIETNMKNSAEEKARVDFENKLMDTLIEKSELEFPPVMVETEMENLISQYLQQLQMTARDQEHYKRMLDSISYEEMRKQYQPTATRRVSVSLLLQKVAEAEKIEIGDADIDAEIERLLQNAGDKKEEQRQFFNNPQNRGYIKQMLTTKNTVQRLTEIAKGSTRTKTKTKTKKEDKK